MNISPHKFLNVGCGTRFHAEWTNIDITPASSAVIPFDIRNSLPFPDNHFDAVYHSHLIEHLNASDAAFLLSEIYRVLKPRGILRVATPDLELIAHVYLEKLTAAIKGEDGAKDDYDWILLELFDQMSRDVTGGEMKLYLERNDLSNREFILKRIGLEAESIWGLRSNESFARMRRAIAHKNSLKTLVQAVRYKVAELFVKLIAGKMAASAFQAGLFRRSGEVHRVLYDRYSLKVIMRRAGFVDIKPCGPGESEIPCFAAYSLEVNNGKVCKPDSFYMEGNKSEVAIS